MQQVDPQTSEDSRDIPFSKGFVFTNKELDDVEHFTRFDLPGGWYLWSDEAVDTEVALSEAEDFLVLRGHWLDTSDDAQKSGTAEMLLSDFLRGGELQFHRRLAMLGGRFFLALRVGAEVWVYNDATGLRSVYYSRNESVAASHLNLLIQLLPQEPQFIPKTTLHALDATPYPGVRQLLPNFRLDALRSEVQRFFPFEPNRFTEMDPGTRLDRVVQLWDRVMEYYYHRSQNLAISITGGLDSRLMLAMCGVESNRFTSYTYGVDEVKSAYSESLNLDFKLVRSMLPYLDLKSHEFIDISKRTRPTDSLARVLDLNTWGNHGRYLVPRYRDIFPGDGWYHLRGTGVEIIRRYWTNNPQKARGLSGLLGPLTAQSDGHILEERAVELGYDQTQHGYDLTDLLYWEIRMGKWHAEILNEQDAAFETFLPISVREIYELLLAYPKKERQDATAVTDLINRKNPILNFWGVNTERNLYEQSKADKKALKTLIAEKTSVDNTDPKHATSNGVTLCLPESQFYAGNYVSTDIYSSSDSGLLTFVIEQPFRNLNAQGYFEWQITLNGKCYLKCDGAVSSSPATISIWNLPKNVTVSLVIRAHKDSPRASWERASRMSARTIEFVPGKVEGDGRTRIASNNPLALITTVAEDHSVSNDAESSQD